MVSGSLEPDPGRWWRKERHTDSSICSSIPFPKHSGGQDNAVQLGRGHLFHVDATVGKAAKAAVRVKEDLLRTIVAQGLLGPGHDLCRGLRIYCPGTRLISLVPLDIFRDEGIEIVPAVLAVHDHVQAHVILDAHGAAHLLVGHLVELSPPPKSSEQDRRRPPPSRSGSANRGTCHPLHRGNRLFWNQDACRT
ncbi:hypothetical protein SAMN06295888_11266 [Desulfonatronum zhilinae]|nr:hypothetical protein SAMN06295888_11266 [Desulfonatronum zhilinae]